MVDPVSFSFTLQALFEQSIARYSDNQAYAYTDGTRYTYREVGEAVYRLRFYLSRHGLMPGDNIALISENKPQWGISYFAITTMGCVAVPVLTDFSTVEINTVLQHAEVKALFVSEKVYRRIKDKVTLPELVILVDTFRVVPTGKMH
jgi:long-chain acyl-CoA synthetase